jgi:hypothetical protein
MGRSGPDRTARTDHPRPDHSVFRAVDSEKIFRKNLKKIFLENRYETC